MPIKVMLSSTVADLRADREVAASVLNSTGIVDLLGVEPALTPAQSASPFLGTVDLARQCDLYILILGKRYGFDTGFGYSATEAEYLAAYKADPTKLLVFRKNVPRVDSRQKEFIQRVSNYHKGYFLSAYQDLDELERGVRDAFNSWLGERAAIGRNLSYFDHFMRFVTQRQPYPGITAEYRVTQSRVELTYRLPEMVRSVHFEKSHIYADFWGSIAHLEEAFEKWRNGELS